MDVLDATAVDAHAADVAAAHGLHIAFNATANDDVQGTPLLDMAFPDVLQPVTKALTTQYRIAAAVAPHMAAGGGGAIVCMAGGREAIPDLGGSHVAWSALAGLCRQLAAELGPRNIRVAWLLSPGSPTNPRRRPTRTGLGACSAADPATPRSPRPPPSSPPTTPPP